jgi:hypothetical protein
MAKKLLRWKNATFFLSYKMQSKCESVEDISTYLLILYNNCLQTQIPVTASILFT